MDLQRLYIQPRQPQASNAFLKTEDHLDDRIVAQVALWPQLLHQTLEGKVLMRPGLQGDGPHPPQDLAEAGISREVRAQGEGVHKQTDQSFGLLASPVVDRGTNDHVTATREGRKPEEQHLEGGEQRYEGRGPLTPPHFLQRRSG